MTSLNKRTLPALAKQRGLTLVELMVALVLGLVLIGGMYTLLTVNKQSIRVLNNVSLAQEKANFALTIMTEDIQMAGWPGVYHLNGTNPYGDPSNGTANQFATTTENGRFDRLIVSRRAREGIPGHVDPVLAQNERDCLGNLTDTGEVLVHQYSVNSNQELICTPLPGSTNQVIIRNVEAFKVLYGVDTLAGPCPNPAPGAVARDSTAECMHPTVYVPGTQLQAVLGAAATTFNDPSQLRPVKTIRLGIAVSSEDRNIISPTQSQALTFNLFGTRYAHNSNGSIFNQGRVIKYSLRTVTLRQALRGP